MHSICNPHNISTPRLHERSGQAGCVLLSTTLKGPSRLPTKDPQPLLHNACLFLHKEIFSFLFAVVYNPAYSASMLPYVLFPVVYGIRWAQHVTPSIRKTWHYLRRQAAVTRSV
jgi:hypothetical protein